MNDIFHDNNDSLTELVEENTWKKVIDKASKTGYSEGISDGSISVFQQGFDKGYEAAFQATFIIGVYKGLSKYLKKNSDYPENIQNILADTKKGICYLCQNKLTNLSNQSIIEIQNCQKEHSKKILKILKDYFDPLLVENEINLDLIKAA